MEKLVGLLRQLQFDQEARHEKTIAVIQYVNTNDCTERFLGIIYQEILCRKIKKLVKVAA